MSKTILGIDVSKRELVVALLVDNNHVFKNKFANDNSGYNALLKWLHSKGYFNIGACLESTGNYGVRVTEFLSDHGYEVYVVNPVCIKSYAKSKLTRTKTDEIDAYVIAEYATKHRLTRYRSPEAHLKKLKALYRCLDDLKKYHTDLSNHLEEEDFLPEEVCSSWRKMVKQTDKEIARIESSIEELIAQNNNLKQHYSNLQTISGIGKTTAVAILAETPDISSFKSPRQLAAYAGLVPKHRLSGTSVRGRTRLSKIGSAKLRKALYLPALVAKNHNPIFEEFSKKMKRKGKPAKVIICAIMRKLLHIIFAIIKNKSTFDPNIYFERQNLPLT